MNTQRNALLLGTIVLAVFCSSPSCVVGDAISLQYENTVSYFNAFYNARRLFSEAEDEIMASRWALRGKDLPAAPAGIPSTAKAKLNLVIDKCSNILVFHSTSSYVDDALFLVGKSFFYQEEYLKADRKFEEMLSQYPTSSLHLEAEWWYARCKDKLNKPRDALAAADTLIAHARASDEVRFEVEGGLLAASVLRRIGQNERAFEMLQGALGRASSDDQRERIETALGDLHAGMGQERQSVQDYQAASDLADDIYDSYYARFHEAISLRKVRSFDESRRILEGMRNDFRYREWRNSVLFELGRSFAEDGKLAEAVDVYRIVDTALVRNEYSVRAAFELARVQETSFGDYAEARRYYGRAQQIPSAKVTEEAKRRFNAFTRYFELKAKRTNLDSSYRAQRDTLVRTPKPDSLAGAMRRDTATTMRDSVRRTPQPPAFVLSADSVRRAHSIWSQDMGDLFYAEIEVPDSAMVWYLASLEDGTDTLRTPRLFYILAELARTNPDRGFVPAEERYRQLIERYPHSDYAAAARRVIGKEVVSTAGDAAEALYAESEALMDSTRYVEAMERFRRIAKLYPQSPFAVKSEYALAWIYEHRLARSDSAIAQYRHIATEHPKTIYAPIASRKVVGADARRDSIAAAESLRRAAALADSVRNAQAALAQDSARARSAAAARVDSTRARVSPGARPDSSRALVAPRAPADSIRARVNPVVVPDTVRRVGVPDSAAIRNRREAIQKKQLIDPN